MPTKLILIRHGETDWNALRRYQGHADTQLNDNGLRQASILNIRMAGEGVQRVFSSDSRRASLFAKLIFPNHVITEMAELRELNFGIFEGLTYEELMAKHPEIYSVWLKDPLRVAIPGGESMEDLKRRVWKVMDNILLSDNNLTYAIVTHAGPIRIILNHICGCKDFWRLKPSSASISIIENTSGLIRVIKENDTSHLYG